MALERYGYSMNPLHLHLLSNHIPVIGGALGLVTLLGALILRSTVAIRTALVVATLATATTPLVDWSGEEAEERLEHSSVLDAAGKKWMDIHEDRAEIAVGALLVACGLCLAALAAGAWKPTWLIPISLVAALALAIGLGLGAWAGSAGGQIRHSEIRSDS